ncbi:MAG: hypothetical protein HFE39_04200 [Clostridiales bacterium]|nr:hypothetical protein [Clostridiales bacterium]
MKKKDGILKKPEFLGNLPVCPPLEQLAGMGAAKRRRALADSAGKGRRRIDTVLFFP